MQATGRKVVLEPVRETTESGLIVAGEAIDFAGRAPITCTVISVGVDIYAADAKARREGGLPADFVELKVGDRVIARPFAGCYIKELDYLVCEYGMLEGIIGKDDDVRAKLIAKRRQEQFEEEAGLRIR